MLDIVHHDEMVVISSLVCKRCLRDRLHLRPFSTFWRLRGKNQSSRVRDASDSFVGGWKRVSVEQIGRVEGDNGTIVRGNHDEVV